MRFTPGGVFFNTPRIYPLPPYKYTTHKLPTVAAALCQADEMEVAYRKEQGIENFAPSRASKAASPSATEVADPSNAAAQAAAAAALAAGTTPESRAALVEQLEDLPSESKRVIEKMESLKSEGLAPRQDGGRDIETEERQIGTHTQDMETEDWRTHRAGRGEKRREATSLFQLLSCYYVIMLLCYYHVWEKTGGGGSCTE